VDGGFVRDADGRALVLRGANLSGANKLPPYFGFQQEPDYQRMRDAWGMNAVRFLISWAAIEPNEGEYDDAYLDDVAMRVDWAAQANLLVVLDMHQDVYGEGFAIGGGDGAPKWSCDASNYATFKPDTQWFLNDLSKEVTTCYDHFWQTQDLHDHYKEAWRRVALKLKDKANVVGFDPMNEPYWGSAQIPYFEQSFLEPFYEDLVPVIRSVAPTWVAFLEPFSFRNIGGTTRLTPFSFGDVVYAPHSYDRDAESGMGFDPSHRAPLMMNVASLATEAKGLNAALWIGEYGGNPDSPGIADYMTAQYDAAGAASAGAMYWAYDESGGYGLLNPDGTEKKALLDVVVRPYPERVAGTPSTYGFDATTKTFTVTYAPDTNIKAPTVLSIPARVYPSGYMVECGGCASTQSPGSLTIDTPPPGDTVTISIHP
jgi:endoglycosylceramidase